MPKKLSNSKLWWVSMIVDVLLLEFVGSVICEGMVIECSYYSRFTYYWKMMDLFGENKSAFRGNRTHDIVKSWVFDQLSLIAGWNPRSGVVRSDNHPHLGPASTLP
ncbi:hypothetical protein BC833DRAFT_562044 [Globomyces pollinis-pini]|nr:hypothetical protein BC833DRAFT_562044 [Globomyces pollinis-pini]